MSAACEVGLNTIECEHPPVEEPTDGSGYPPVRTRCWMCGQRACRSCSKMRPWLGITKRGWRRSPKRICNDCAREYQQASD